VNPDEQPQGKSGKNKWERRSYVRTYRCT
jgi:hypothetical protein